MKKVLVICLGSILTGLSVTAAAQSAMVIRETPLSAEPYAGAENKSALPGETRVEILERKGGWYRVKVPGSAQEGWVRMASIRLTERMVSERETGVGSMFSATGRSQSRDTVATTGIRGLSEEEINSATPNPAAVAVLDSFAVNERAAREFAAEIKLDEPAVVELPEEIEKDAAR